MTLFLYRVWRNSKSTEDFLILWLAIKQLEKNSIHPHISFCFISCPALIFSAFLSYHWYVRFQLFFQCNIVFLFFPWFFLISLIVFWAMILRGLAKQIKYLLIVVHTNSVRNNIKGMERIYHQALVRITVSVMVWFQWVFTFSSSLTCSSLFALDKICFFMIS